MTENAFDTPMFPLGMVLFPHTPLALRIFEERYLKMLGALLDADEPDFGVVLIERGSELGGGDSRFAVGTLARLSLVDPHAEAISVLARGTQRIEIERWLDDEPYPRAMVRAVPDLRWDEALLPLLTETETIVRRVLGAVGASGETRWDAGVELSDVPVERAWQLAAIAPVGPLDQLGLLQATTLAGLLATTIDLTLATDELLRADGNDDPE